MHTPFPRLLPVTIVAMAALLVLKLLVLADVLRDGPQADAAALAAGVAMVSVAHAASPEAPPAKSGEGAAPAKPGEAGAKPAAGTPTRPAAMAGREAPAAARPDAARPEPAIAAAEPSAPPPMSDSERQVLLDLRQRRRELDARENGLTAREAMVTAAEHRLATRLTELTALQTRLETLDRARNDRAEANWRGLTKVYEDMKPRDAAGIFNGLENSVLLGSARSHEGEQGGADPGLHAAGQGAPGDCATRPDAAEEQQHRCRSRCCDHPGRGPGCSSRRHTARRTRQACPG